MSRLKLTRHAVHRWKVRGGVGSLQAAADNAVPYGVEHAGVRRMQTKCGHMLVTKDNTVITVLTGEQALNTGARAAMPEHIRKARDMKKSKAALAPITNTEKAELMKAAVRHAVSGNGKEFRQKYLVKKGIDSNSHRAELYRMAFAAAIEMKSAMRAASDIVCEMNPSVRQKVVAILERRGFYKNEQPLLTDGKPKNTMDDVGKFPISASQT